MSDRNFKVVDVRKSNGCKTKFLPGKYTKSHAAAARKAAEQIFNEGTDDEKEFIYFKLNPDGTIPDHIINALEDSVAVWPTSRGSPPIIAAAPAPPPHPTSDTSPAPRSSTSHKRRHDRDYDPGPTPARPRSEDPQDSTCDRGKEIHE